MLGIEIGERLVFYGIFVNLVIYLIYVLYEGIEKLVINVNNWMGMIFFVFFLGVFFVDVFWGRFWIIFIFGVVYFVVSVNVEGKFVSLYIIIKY